MTWLDQARAEQQALAKQLTPKPKPEVKRPVGRPPKPLPSLEVRGMAKLYPKK